MPTSDDRVQSEAELSHEEAREELKDAIDAIYAVQTGYDLTEEEEAMLGDAKSSIAAVHFHCDNREVVFDL